MPVLSSRLTCASLCSLSHFCNLCMFGCPNPRSKVLANLFARKEVLRRVWKPLLTTPCLLLSADEELPGLESGSLRGSLVHICEVLAVAMMFLRPRMSAALWMLSRARKPDELFFEGLEGSQRRSGSVQVKYASTIWRARATNIERVVECIRQDEMAIAD